MPTPKATTPSILLESPIGVSDDSAAKVAFFDRAGPKTVFLKTPATFKALVGEIPGAGTGDIGVTGTREGGETVLGIGVTHWTLERLDIGIKEMPIVANLKTSHGGVGIRARVQPGEPATSSAIQVLTPRVDAVDIVVIEL